MRQYLPKRFRFSPTITILAIVLAGLMLRASAWQWERYNYKVALVETYEANSTAKPAAFPTTGENAEDFDDVLHRRVQLSGRYDFERQMIVTNRKHASGPGHWLLTPLKIDGSEQHVVVARGFIPFADREPSSWEKYSFQTTVTLDGVVQPTVPHRTVLSPKNPDVGTDKPFAALWLYPDIENMARQLPYPVITYVYVQKIGGPPRGSFPAESISIQVPPSTHLGYTIEWILLALATLTIGFLLQAFPRNKTGKLSSI